MADERNVVLMELTNRHGTIASAAFEVTDGEQDIANVFGKTVTWIQENLHGVKMVDVAEAMERGDI